MATPQTCFNAGRIFRPLWAGTAIMSPSVKTLGTAGCFATDATGRIWLVTATHVLCAARPVAGTSIPVFQPNLRTAGARICAGELWRISSTDDVLAVALDTNVSAIAAALGIGKWTSVLAPVENVVVVKSGAATGVTLGVVRRFDAQRVQIKPFATFPAGYETTAAGDSGAAWIEADSKRVIGIHLGTLPNGDAQAIRADAAFRDFALSLL